jgi:hypothetical protein
VLKTWKKKCKSQCTLWRHKGESNIQNTQKYSSITFQQRSFFTYRKRNPVPNEYKSMRLRQPWSRRIIHVILCSMNKKSVTFTFLLSTLSTLTFISSSLRFYLPLLCYQLTLAFWCFMFDIPTFLMQRSMDLWFRHTSMSVIIIACGGNPPLCLSSPVVSTRLWVSVDSRLSSWVNRHIFINVIIWKI